MNWAKELPALKPHSPGEVSQEHNYNTGNLGGRGFEMEVGEFGRRSRKAKTKQEHERRTGVGQASGQWDERKRDIPEGTVNAKAQRQEEARCV